MTEHNNEQRRPARRAAKRGWTRSQRIRAALCLGIIPGLGAVGTQASWTDTATATSGQFTTGTVDIKLGNPAVDNEPAAFSTALAMTNMAPGSSREAGLLVTNGGSLPVTFSVAGSGNGDLASALRVSVFPSLLNGVCGGTAIVSDVALSGQLLPPQPVLAAGTTRDLCIRVTLPSTADTSLQGKTTTVALTFTATNA